MVKVTLAGESSILIYFGDKIDARLPKNIANFANALKAEFSELIIDLTPAYTSLLVSYDLGKINYLKFAADVERLLNGFDFSSVVERSELIHIPVYYGFETGLDLERFSPVFAFLAEVDSRIQAPRLATPRIKIPAGSVGIADSQTAVYPTDSSGGWNIIGRTLLDLSLNNPDNLNKFKTGDRVKFYPITRDEYIKYGGGL